MKKPLVTILTTVKNGASTLEQTIDSVLNQTYKNIEYIIIDDGSTDDTHYILDNYESEDNRINVFKTGGVGRSRALNMGIAISKGKYISIIDADDLFHPKKVEIQIQVFENNPDYFLVSTNSIMIYDDDYPTWENIKLEESYSIESISSKIFIRNSIAHSSVMMDKEQLENIGMYSTEQKTQIDYELWLRVYSYNLTLVNVKLPLTAKRIHKHQSYENRKRVRYIKNATKLQLSNIIKNKTYWYYLPIPILKFGLSFLPVKVRHKLTDLL